jgi:hypothetical protein
MIVAVVAVDCSPSSALARPLAAVVQPLRAAVRQLQHPAADVIPVAARDVIPVAARDVIPVAARDVIPVADRDVIPVADRPFPQIADAVPLLKPQLLAPTADKEPTWASSRLPQSFRPLLRALDRNRMRVHSNNSQKARVPLGPFFVVG